MGSAPQMTSTNTAGIRTKKMNLSLKISVIVPPRNNPRACYKCKITHESKEIIQQRYYFVAIVIFHQTKLYSVLCTDPVYTAVLCQDFSQCTQDIFVCSDIGMVYSGICIDLENRYTLDSALYID